MASPSRARDVLDRLPRGRALVEAVWRARDHARRGRERRLRGRLGLPFPTVGALPSIEVVRQPSSPGGRKVLDALDRALAGPGKVSEAMRAIEGMSGQRYRTYINELTPIAAWA